MEEKYEKNYHGTLLEIFDHGGPLEKFSKVRITFLVMKNKHSKDFLITEEVPQAVTYFRKRFLDGQKLSQISTSIYHNAMDALHDVVGMPDPDIPADQNMKPKGCYKKCLMLVARLNEYARQEGYPEVDADKEIFPFYTLWEEPILNFDGWPDHDERGRIKTKFTNQRHLDSFRKELLKRLKNGEKPSFNEIDEEIRKRFKTSNGPNSADKGTKNQPG